MNCSKSVCSFAVYLIHCPALFQASTASEPSLPTPFPTSPSRPSSMRCPMWPCLWQALRLIWTSTATTRTTESLLTRQCITSPRRDSTSQPQTSLKAWWNLSTSSASGWRAKIWMGTKKTPARRNRSIRKPGERTVNILTDDKCSTWRAV